MLRLSRFSWPPNSLHHTWCFRLAMLAFVASSTKYIDVMMHDTIGMFALLALAVIAAAFEGSLDTIVRNIRRNGMHNQWMIMLIVWYLIGVLGKMYFAGATDADWRLATAPVKLVIGLLIALGFLCESRCARTLQIVFIVMVGVQSLFTALVITEDPTIVRIAVDAELTGRGWIYGDQGGFAMQAMLLPILACRAFAERGMLRIILLACCATIGWAVAISQFATAFGLLLLSFPIALLLAIRYLKHQRLLLRVLSILCFGGMVFVLLWLMNYSPLMMEVRTRIVNAWNDPKSGGYEARYADQSRWYLAQISFNTFSRHPLFGEGAGSIRNSKFVGGHSSFFDMLGFYGLLGGAGAFLAMLLLMLAHAWRRLRRKMDWEAVVAATSVMLLLISGVVNPYWEGAAPVMVLMLGRLFILVQRPTQGQFSSLKAMATLPCASPPSTFLTGAGGRVSGMGWQSDSSGCRHRRTFIQARRDD